MIDLASLAEARLEIARELFYNLTISDEFNLYAGGAHAHDNSIIRDRHWNIGRALITPENSLLLADDVAWADIWRELHLTPGLVSGKFTAMWTSLSSLSDRRRQLQLSTLQSDGLYGLVRTFRDSVWSQLPETTRPAYSVEIHTATTIQQVLEWIGMGGGTHEPGSLPPIPLSMKDRTVDVVRGLSMPLNPTAYGGILPYVFSIKENSDPVILTVTGGVISTSPSRSTHVVNTEYDTVIEVTDAAGTKAQAVFTIKTEASS